MRHEPFGELTYNPDDEAWNGYAPLPRLAALGVRPQEAVEPTNPQEQLAEAQNALGRIQEAMRARFGTAADRVIDALEKESEEAEAGDPDDEEDDEDDLFDKDQEAMLDRQAAKMQDDEGRCQEGLFPVNVIDPLRAGPSPHQQAAFAHLIENEVAISRAVQNALFQSYQSYYADEHWRRFCSLPEVASPDALTSLAQLLNVEVTREHHNGASYLLFRVDCDWEMEHGMNVVYHRDKPAAEWATADTVYDLLESDEPVDDEDLAPPPGNQELFDAVLANDEDRVRELIAQGHDINDVGEDPFPPLCYAIETEELDVDLVKRLLAIGADPNIKDYENKTALRRAKSMLKIFAPKKGLLGAMMGFARQANPSQFDGYRARAEEIVRLLEAAGAK
jgi:hypothetical protein